MQEAATEEGKNDGQMNVQNRIQGEGANIAF
jgi:hypothetical protein